MKIRSLIVSIGLLLASVAAASAEGPAPEFTLKEQYTAKSPDGATTVEQYFKTDKDGNYIWQFWARRSDSMTLLVPEQEDYPADFRFTRDSRWIVRLQKTGSGEGSMFLYKLGAEGFVAATKKPFSDLAWDYFYKQREVQKDQEEAGISHLCRPAEGDRRQLQFARRELAGQSLPPDRAFGRCRCQGSSDGNDQRLAVPL